MLWRAQRLRCRDFVLDTLVCYPVDTCMFTSRCGRLKESSPKRSSTDTVLSALDQDREYTIPALPAELHDTRLTCVQTAQGDKRAGGSRLWHMVLMQVRRRDTIKHVAACMTRPAAPYLRQHRPLPD